MRPHLEERVDVEHVVDDDANVVRGVRARRDDRRSPRAVARSTGSSVRPARRILEVVGRAGSRAPCATISRAVVLVVARRSDATPLRVPCIAAPPSVRWSTSIPVNARTVSGPVTYANASSVITTTSAMPEQERRARTRRGRRPRARRDDARGIGQRARDASPRVQRRDALGDVGAGRRDGPDDRHAELDREPDGTLERSCALGGPIAPTCLPPAMRNAADRAAVDLRERGSRGLAALRRERRGRRRVRVTALGVSTKDALCPPNPNEFDTTGRGPISRGAAGDDVERDVVAGAARGSRSAARPRRGCESSDATASAAPAPPIMWPSTPLVEVTGGASSPNTLRIASRLGGVVELGRRAVRVDVADVGRRRARRRRARAACTRAAPAPPGDGAVMWYASALRP